MNRIGKSIARTSRRRHSGQRGMTLLEIMIVLAILALVMGLVVGPKVIGMFRESKVDIRVPQRGDKRTLLETVTRNAQEEFTRHRLKRATDHNARARPT